MTSTSISDTTVLWRFLNGRQEAYCLLLPHPIGREIRYFFNGLQLIGVVSGDADELEQRAEHWKLRLLTEGWSEAEPRLSAIAGRMRSAGRA
jgi:hypothetical protein